MTCKFQTKIKPCLKITTNHVHWLIMKNPEFITSSYNLSKRFPFQGLRDCCRSIRIGKILVESDTDTHEAHVVYAKFPEDIARRQVLLMYPIMSTGNTVKQVAFTDSP